MLTEAARAANFTNEGGVDGTTRFLRNVMGLWVLTQAMEAWGETDIAAVLAEAAPVPAGGPVVDVDDAAVPAARRHGGSDPGGVRTNRPGAAGPGARPWPGACSTASRWPTGARCGRPWR